MIFKFKFPINPNKNRNQKRDNNNYRLSIGDKRENKKKWAEVYFLKMILKGNEAISFFFVFSLPLLSLLLLYS